MLFNHESPRRGEDFVTRKITLGLSRIDLGIQKCLLLGNLDSKRDWGHAREFVEMQWRMLQQDVPEDYVISTGRQSSVRDFIELSAKYLNWKGISWDGEGVNEIGRRKDNGEVVVRVSPEFFRPAEVETLLGNPNKALKKLNWQPKISLDDLVKEMIKSDKEYAHKQKLFINNSSKDIPI